MRISLRFSEVLGTLNGSKHAPDSRLIGRAFLINVNGNWPSLLKKDAGK
jgi:hypothetical protein